jgi:two-component system cell cycle response regulator
MAVPVKKRPTREELRTAIAALAASTNRLQDDAPPSPEIAAALDALAAQAEALAANARAAARTIDRGSTPAARPGARPRIVIIDDDAATLAVMTELLGEAFEVATARDATTGLRLIHEQRADAVVTDLRMPGMSGLELLRALQSHPATATLPCLVVTADEAVVRKPRAFDLGAADYLVKPVDADELAARLRHRIADARRLRAEQDLQELDELTRLPNRRALVRHGPRCVAEARVAERPLTVAFVDADGLKGINDTWGHAVGDRAIQTIATALRASKRGDDLALRIGGDEFAVIMPGTSLDGARMLVQRFHAELAAHPVALGEARVAIRASVGLAALSDRDLGWDELLARSDRALYDEKRRRRERVVEMRPAGAGARRR